MYTHRTRPELLAPAGDWEALRAAVANGADACTSAYHTIHIDRVRRLLRKPAV